MGHRDAQENGVAEKIDGKNMVDFKGEAITFKATTFGVLSTLQHCLDLMSMETESWKRKLNKATKHKVSFHFLEILS
jgi:collagen type IV alpha-3-binding protein